MGESQAVNENMGLRGCLSLVYIPAECCSCLQIHPSFSEIYLGPRRLPQFRNTPQAFRAPTCLRVGTHRQMGMKVLYRDRNYKVCRL